MSGILESSRDLEITNIDCDSEMQKVITLELERHFGESLEFSLKKDMKNDWKMYYNNTTKVKSDTLI